MSTPILAAPLQGESAGKADRNVCPTVDGKSSAVSWGAWAVVLILIAVIGSQRSGIDAAVLALSVSIIQGAVRRVLALAAILLLYAAFPPWELPTFAFCFAPLMWIWRERAGRKTSSHCGLRLL